MQDLATGGQSADIITLSDHLQRLDALENVGGLAYLGTLARDTPGTANIRAHAEIVKEKSRIRGLTAIAGTVEQAVSGGANSGQIHQRMQARLNDIDLDGPWPLPLPLVTEAMGVPYPLDALPAGLANAVREVAGFVQCPVALAACSALSALSVAGQGLVNVCRGDSLIGPVGLYLLAIAESGERKSECDRRFSDGLHAWQVQQMERIKPDLASYRAALTAWEVELDAIQGKLKKARTDGQSASEARSDLERLEANKPQPVRVPRILLESETAESLSQSLARPDGWPCALES